MTALPPNRAGLPGRELGRREPGEDCRLEMMHATMEQMMRHRLAAQESDLR